MAVVSPLMSGLALSSGLGLVYLTAVHTSSPLAFSRKVFQRAFFARLMALRRSRRAALVALVLFGRSARVAVPSSFLSSEISSVYQRLEGRRSFGQGEVDNIVTLRVRPAAGGLLGVVDREPVGLHHVLPGGVVALVAVCHSTPCYERSCRRLL